MFGTNFKITTLATRARSIQPNPSQLSSLKAWFDPSDLSTLYQDAAATLPVAADGDQVGAMLDKSGNGYHLMQVTASARPTYRTNGTRHWLEFDGINNTLSINSRLGFSTNPSLTISANLQPVSYSASDHRVLHIGASGTSGNLGAAIGPSGAGQGWRYDNGNVLFSHPDAGSDYIMSWVRSEGATYGAGRAFRDGMELVSSGSSSASSVPTNSTESMSVGARGTSLFANILLYGLVILESDSDLDRAQSETWVGTR
ncbi:hypothetical protein [Pacificibacter sp. AS14]|uniref:hypothetical protein n=1 Tax=Alphaproteobacteria TaxID=28211 RepID=UPI003178B4CA